MKVLQINSVCGIGSTGRICADIADVLRECGHECKIAYGREKVPEKYQKYAVRIGGDIDVVIHGIGSRIFDHHGFYSKNATKEFIRWIEEYNPDVIHLHNIHGYYVNVDLLFQYLKVCGKKIIWTLHDCWAFTGHCAHFDFLGCRQWKSGCDRCPQVRKYPKCFFKGDVSKNFDRKKDLFTGVPNLTIVTPSRWLSDLVKESFLREYSVEVIYNGIDLSIFKPTVSNFRQEHHISAGTKIVLGVAFNWGKRKGLDVMIELAKRLDRQYQVVLVGTDDDVDKQLPTNIISIHKTHDQRELVQIYLAADVFVNPTREEVLGLVNVEALACGVPVVAFRTGGCPEILNEDCGVIVNCDDICELEKKVKWICSSKQFSVDLCLKRAADFDAGEKFYAYIEEYQK